MHNPTKHKLAEALKTLMKEKPLGKISVHEITDYCGLNRQSFYYHFADKYRLINWIFDREVMDIVEPKLVYEHWAEALVQVFNIVEQNSPFYLNALHDNFSFFYLHLMNTQRNILECIIDDLLEGRNLAQQDRDFFADFYTNAFVGSFVGWINSSMPEPGRLVVERIQKIITGSLRSSLEDYIKD